MNIIFDHNKSKNLKTNMPFENPFAAQTNTRKKYPSRAQHILSPTGNDSDEVEDDSVLKPRRHSSSNLLDVLASKSTTEELIASKRIRTEHDDRANPTHGTDNIDSASEDDMFGEQEEAASATGAHGSRNANAGSSNMNNIKHNVPLDWSMKYALKFKSEIPFMWSTAIKSMNSVSGISSFLLDKGNTNMDEYSNLHEQSVFQNALMYYVHPSLPWSKTFADAIGKIPPEKYSTLQNKPLIDHLEAINNDWNASFHSLFQALKNGHCPYFYVVAKDFTAVFRAPGIGGSPDFSATISSSTKGFRAALDREEVEYHVPLVPQYHEQQRKRQEAAVVLERVAKNQQGPYRIETKLSTDNEFMADGTSNSMLYIDDFGSIHSLFEFFLNRKFSRTMNANMQEPPTLYSERAFLNCTLKQMRTKFCGPLNVAGKRGATRSISTHHVLELEGPSLPRSLFLLCELFRITQENNFELSVLKVDRGTGALNVKCSDKDFDDEGEQYYRQELYQCSDLGASVLSTLVCKEGQITYTTKTGT